MGWWGKGILSGDTPLDCMAAFSKAVGLKGYDWENHDNDETIYPIESMKELVIKKIKTQIETDNMVWLRIGQDHKHDSCIYTQVGAVIALAVGAKLSDEYKKKAIAIIQQDEWAHQEEERKTEIGQLCETIKKSDGSKRLVLSSVGLI